MVNLLLTDEEIGAKVAELVNRKLREFIQANVIETNLRLRESQLATARQDLVRISSPGVDLGKTRQEGDRVEHLASFMPRAHRKEGAVQITHWGR